mgnify:CR=1 FL=1
MPDAGASKSKSNDYDFDILVVGGGLAGLYSVYRFRKMGLSIKVLEAGDGVGGLSLIHI